MATALPLAEGLAARRLAWARLAYLIALGAYGALVVALGAIWLEGEASWRSAVRNYVWFVGLGLAAGIVMRPPWRWTVPLAWTGWLATGSLLNDKPGYPWYAVPAQPDGNSGATWQALAMLAVGLAVLVSGAGPRPRASTV
jgi:hypothetical protein